MGFACKITDQQTVHFIPCTVAQWVDVFTRREYADIVINSIKFCQKEKGLCVFGWVIMSNHLHMICSCRPGFELSNVMRDFKKFTSTSIVDTIEATRRESRRNWMLWLFRQKNDILYWQPGNHPEEIRTRDFFQQKLDYIHNNPIRAGIVDKAEEYKYSSARDFCGVNGLIELTHFE